MFPRCLRKTLLSCKTSKKLLKMIYVSKIKERINSGKFSIVDALRKWRSGTQREEDPGLKLAQPQGETVRPSLVTAKCPLLGKLSSFSLAWTQGWGLFWSCHGACFLTALTSFLWLSSPKRFSSL